MLATRRSPAHLRPSCRWLLQQVAVVVLVPGVLAGCAGKPLEYRRLVDSETTDVPKTVELKETPFFPNDTYHCGPAALATLLADSGVTITAAEVVDQTYLPELQGTLQHELLGAARRAGRVPYELDPSLEDLLLEIAHGHPVLVLQNLALELFPIWHYAVVVGYDLEAATVTLRSDEERRKTVAMRRFERTWQRAEQWAIVIPAPSDTPASASADRWVAAVSELERQARWEAARAGYQAAKERWPEHSKIWLGLGNVRYAAGDYGSAATAYQQAVEHDEGFAAAQHNLAWALVRQGEVNQALEAAKESEALAPEHPRYGSIVEEIIEAAEEIK